jgi:hypothetical protein
MWEEEVSIDIKWLFRRNIGEAMAIENHKYPSLAKRRFSGLKIIAVSDLKGFRLNREIRKP